MHAAAAAAADAPFHAGALRARLRLRYAAVFRDYGYAALLILLCFAVDARRLLPPLPPRRCRRHAACDDIRLFYIRLRHAAYACATPLLMFMLIYAAAFCRRHALCLASAVLPRLRYAATLRQRIAARR